MLDKATPYIHVQHHKSLLQRYNIISHSYIPSQIHDGHLNTHQSFQVIIILLCMHADKPLIFNHGEYSLV